MLAMTFAAAGSVYASESDEDAPKASVVTTKSDNGASEAETEYIIIDEENAYQEPENENPLNGLNDLDEEAIGKRPVAVMINNHPDALPQYNIEKADLLFEIVVEHGYSRYLAFFADYQNVPYLVSIRSYRYYFPAISNGFDAFYIHWGEDQTMMWYYNELGLDSYDGLSNTYLFGRDQERLDAGYDLEHTSCFYGNLLPDQLAMDGKRTELKEAYQGPAFKFVPYGTMRIPGNEECNFMSIVFGDNQESQFVYNEEKGVYEKFTNGDEHIDGISNEQLEFENVIVLYTKIADRDDEPEADRKFIEVLPGLDADYATGYYASEGSVQNIRWGKEDESSRLMLFDEDGNELELNRGKTYIAITYIDNAEVSDVIPEEFLEENTEE